MLKQKKNKKQNKHAIEEFILREKIRDVKINERQHFMFYISMMVLFNAILVASVAFVLVYLNMWYNWVLCFMVVAVCVYLTFNTYLHEKNFHKCAIHKNAIVVNSIWFNSFRIAGIYLTPFSFAVLYRPITAFIRSRISFCSRNVATLGEIVVLHISPHKSQISLMRKATFTTCIPFYAPIFYFFNAYSTLKAFFCFSR